MKHFTGLRLTVRTALLRASVGSLSLPAWISGQSPSNAAVCSGKPFKHLTSRYDRIRGKTMVQITANLPRPLLAPKVEALLLEAEHSGESSDSVVTPRLFVVQDAVQLGVQVGTRFTIDILADDSVRYSWPTAMQGPQMLNNYPGFGLGLVPVVISFMESPPAELASFAQASHAAIAINERRYKLEQKRMLPIAEIDRWARCPSDRHLARKQK